MHQCNPNQGIVVGYHTASPEPFIIKAAQNMDTFSITSILEWSCLHVRSNCSFTVLATTVGICM